MSEEMKMDGVLAECFFHNLPEEDDWEVHDPRHMSDGGCEKCVPAVIVSRDAWLARAGLPVGVPDVLFDGFAVMSALPDKAKARTSAENVSDVLDAVVKILRAAPSAPAGEAVPVAGVEAPEVVAYLLTKPDGKLCMDAVRHKPGSQPAEAVMLVAQHNRIVAQLAGGDSVSVPRELLERSILHMEWFGNAAAKEVQELRALLSRNGNGGEA